MHRAYIDLRILSNMIDMLARLAQALRIRLSTQQATGKIDEDMSALGTISSRLLNVGVCEKVSRHVRYCMRTIAVTSDFVEKILLERISSRPTANMEEKTRVRRPSIKDVKNDYKYAVGINTTKIKLRN